MLNKLLTLALAAISTEAAKLHAHENTGVRDSTCTGNSHCGIAMKCDAGVCVDWDDEDWYNYLFGSLAQVDHPIAGGEGTGTPQEALPELSVELVADDELAQIKAYSESGLDLLEGEFCSNKKEGATCGYYMSCQSGKCCHDWFGCLSLAQVDQDER